MASQGDSTGDEHLVSWAEKYLKIKYNKPNKAFVGLVHRLDRPVSGVLVLAKTSKALARLNEQFKNKTTQKKYWAICKQSLPETNGVLQHYLSKDSKTHRALTYDTEKPNSKKAILIYRLIHEKNNLYLYEIELQTGRFHQIRAQLAKCKAPILGDLKYGAKQPLPDRSIGLHSCSLQLEHPITKDMLSFFAPLPKTSWWREFEIETN